MDLNKLKKIKIKNIVYPAISAAFLIVALWLFISFSSFLIKSVDKVFSAPEQGEIESRLIKINLEDFDVVAKKLGIVSEPAIIEPTRETAAPEQQIQETAQVPESEQTPSTPVIEDKSIIKIQVLNSVKTAGLAANLKSQLETAGFQNIKTGNQSAEEPVSLIKTKKSFENSLLLNEIKEIILKKYQLDALQMIDETSEFDAIIVIGKK